VWNILFPVLYTLLSSLLIYPYTICLTSPHPRYSKDEAEALGLAEEEDDGDLEQFELQVNRGGYERPLGPPTATWGGYE
jgi:hypothetical protein